MITLLLTLDEAAALLSVGRTTMYSILKSGELPTVKIGKSTRIRRADLEFYVENLSGEINPAHNRGNWKNNDWASGGTGNDTRKTP